MNARDLIIAAVAATLLALVVALAFGWDPTQGFYPGFPSGETWGGGAPGCNVGCGPGYGIGYGLASCGWNEYEPTQYLPACSPFEPFDGPRYDNTAMGPDGMPANDPIEAELARMNDAFVLNREQHHADLGGEQSFAFAMFTADSLRPPGLEHLNGAGPLHGLLEHQKCVGPTDPGVSGYSLGSASNCGRPLPVRRAMRKEGIPINQLTGERAYDRDIEETLGLGGREFDHVHKAADMSRYRSDCGLRYREAGVGGATHSDYL